jgi:hypothetical protein
MQFDESNQGVIVVLLNSVKWFSVFGLVLSVLALALSSVEPGLKIWAGAGNVCFGLLLIVSRHLLKDKSDEQTTGQAGIEHDFD